MAENEPNEYARAPRSLRVTKPVNEAAPHTAMRRYQARSGAHNLAIAARLTPRGVLPDSMVLDSWPGFGFGARKLAALEQLRGLSPSVAAMLGAGQRGRKTTGVKNDFNFPPAGPFLYFRPFKGRFSHARRLGLSGNGLL